MPRELGYEVDLKDEKLKEIADFFKPVRADFLKEGKLNHSPWPRIRSASSIRFRAVCSPT